MTDKQKELFAKLVDIVCQCKSENLEFVYDVEEGKVRTFNAEHNYIEWTEYDGTMSDKFLEMMPKVISNVTHYFSECPEQYKWVEF